MHTELTHPKLRPRNHWHFSIGGLLVLIAGVSVGLAVTRIPRVRWFDGVLAAFAAWFAVGCWTRGLAFIRAAKQSETADERTVRMLFALAQFLAPFVVGLGAGLLIAREAGAESLKMDDLIHSLAFQSILLSLVVVPVIAVCLPFSPRTSRWKLWSVLTDAVGSSLGVVLALAVIGNSLFIPLLVHIAIAGIRGVQRHSPEGDQFSPEPFDPTSPATFASQAVCAAVAWAIAACILRALAKGEWGSRRSWTLGIAFAALMATIGCLLAAGMRLADRQVSPIMIDFVFREKPELFWWLAIPLLLTAITFVTRRLLGGSRSANVESKTLHVPEGMRSWDQWLIVLLAPLLWWIGDSWAQFSEAAELIGTVLSGSAPQDDWFWLEALGSIVPEATTLLMFAYLILWVQLAWRRWRGLENGAALEVFMPASRLVTVWLSSLLLVATAAPVWCWLSLVLWTWPNQLPGEAWFLIHK